LVSPPVSSGPALGGSDIDNDIQHVLFSVLDKEYRETLDSNSRASNLGFCYDGIVDALRNQELTSFVTVPGAELAAALATLPLDLFPTETAAGDLLIAFGDYLAEAVTQGGLPNIFEFLTEQTAGYVLSSLTNDYVADVALGAIGSDSLISYFKRDGVTTIRISASNAGTTYAKSQIVPPTTVQGLVFYSPQTYYVVAAVRGDCQAFSSRSASTASYVFRVAAAPSGFLRNATAASALDVVPIQ